MSYFHRENLYLAVQIFFISDLIALKGNIMINENAPINQVKPSVKSNSFCKVPYKIEKTKSEQSEFAELIYQNPPDDDVLTLEQVSPTDKNWNEHRADTLAVEQIYFQELEFQRYSERLHDCSGFLQFGIGENGLVLRQASFCRVRYCPVCQWRKSMYWRAMMLSNIDEIRENYPKHRWVFLTLTVKNCEITDLKETLKHMNNAWSKLRKRKVFDGVVDGWIRTTEVTRGKDGDNSAHPHFHCLLMVKSNYFTKNYIKQTEWRGLWQSCLKVDYLPVVNVKAVANKSKRKTHSDGIEQAICETLKYSVKPADIMGDGSKKSNDWFFELTRQTHKMRFVATGGALKDMFKKEELTDEEMLATGAGEEEETDERRLAFLFNRSKKKYNYSPSYNL